MTDQAEHEDRLAEKREEIEDRQDQARVVVSRYQHYDGGDDCNLTATQDVISNLLHYAATQGMNDPRALCETAILNYEAERDEAELD